MKNNPANLRFGVIVAPLLGPVTLLLILFVSSFITGNQTHHWNYRDTSDLVSSFLLFMVLGAPFAYFVAVVFGIPAFVLMRKIGRINFWTVSIGSALVSLVPTLILSTWFGFNQSTAENNPLHLYFAMLICGYIVGVTFWFLSGLGSKNVT